MSLAKSLDRKLTALRSSPSSREFILADARDADMAWGISSFGARWPARSNARPFYSKDEFIEQIRETVRQGLIDIMLTSLSTLERLAFPEPLFSNSTVTAALRANDTTDIWLPRGGNYAQEASRPFATVNFAEIFHRPPEASAPLADLGLYSITFNNDLERDRESLLAFKNFREVASKSGFRYFLEIFAPNAIAAKLSPDQIPEFVNDQVVRCLAGVGARQRPEFLKIPYFGPAALEELVGYDSHLIVGILGGSSGTTHDAFKLLADAKRHGARVALFGRKIKEAEDPLTFVSFLRRIADDAIEPKEAVRAYHDALQKLNVPSKRSLEQDLEITSPVLNYRS